MVNRLSGIVAGALAIAAIPATCHAQAAPASAAPTAPSAASDAATPGQPPAPPTFAASGPFSFSGAITADVMSDIAGGQTRGVKLLTKTALTASYDGGADDRPGWSAQASVQYTRGGHISADSVGDIQGVDNIEAFNALRLYELWIAKQWQGGKLGAKFGFTDLNVDFDTQQVGALFVNSSHGIGPEFAHSGLNGPSIYPTTTLALTGFVKPSDSLTVRGGLFNGLAGSPDHPGAFALRVGARYGALAILQAERTSGNGLRTELGGWAYAARFDSLHEVDDQGNPLRRARMLGVYGLVEGQIAGGGEHGRTLSGWIRAGLGDPLVERISGYMGGGLVASGLVKGRPEDQAGIAVAHAIVDAPDLPPGAVPAKRAETSVELTYRTQLRDWLTVQPDLQYVVRPNGDRTIPNALVIGFRFNVNLTRNLVRQVRDSAP